MFFEIENSVLEALIDQALATETPTVPWQEGKAMLLPPTTATLVSERRQLVRWLNRKGELFSRPAARAIASRMAQCKPAQRCLSGACPECTSGFQRALVEANQHHRHRLADEGVGCRAVTLVAKGARFSPGQKSARERERRSNGPLEKLAAAIGRRRNVRVVGGIDLSLNVDRRGPKPFGKPFKTHWRPHLQIHIDEKLWKKIEKDVRKVFPSANQIAKPVVAKVLDLKPEADAYVLKRLWEAGHRNRRESYQNNAVGSLFPEVKTRFQRLRVQERLDQLIYLDDLGLSRRLVLGGCRLKMTEKGPRIRAIG